jgi:ubiquinone/menaquinone biosynthesis C-methylase UbiE
MDSWKFWDIVHQHHTLMNPLDEEKLDELFDLLGLSPGATVTDIGCGKGEMLIRLAKKYRIKGIGVDKSPYCIRDAEKRKSELVPESDLKFLEMDGLGYKPENMESEDLTMCIGASWIYNGYKNTLKALSQMTRSKGRIMVGEPFWKKSPPQTYLRKAKIRKQLFSTHEGNFRIGEAIGLAPLYALVSSEGDWDRYEGLHWFAAREYVVSHPDDPDLKEIQARDTEARETYLHYERDIMGWAIYLFQKK